VDYLAKPTCVASGSGLFFLPAHPLSVRALSTIRWYSTADQTPTTAETSRVSMPTEWKLMPK